MLSPHGVQAQVQMWVCPKRIPSIGTLSRQAAFSAEQSQPFSRSNGEKYGSSRKVHGEVAAEVVSSQTEICRPCTPPAKVLGKEDSDKGK